MSLFFKIVLGAFLLYLFFWLQKKKKAKKQQTSSIRREDEFQSARRIGRTAKTDFEKELEKKEEVLSDLQRQKLLTARARVGVLHDLSKEVAQGDFKDQELSASLALTATTADQVLEELLKDPDEIYKARKFFSVHLENTVAVSQKYAKGASSFKQGDLRDNLLSVLKAAVEVFEEHKQRIWSDDQRNLDAHLKVIEMRLTKEDI